ncbi:hypothetical protein FMO003_04160 [Moritella sp. F3]|nr:hypothetical protein FMO001_16790 [Moritella sp. F1]GIC80135.1 hypothetical protein FMO003_04160 [Moritella sp. F3]
MIAKLFVPFGAFVHLRCGDTSPPEQPNPLNSCVLDINCPWAISWLDSVKEPANTEAETVSDKTERSLSV